MKFLNAFITTSFRTTLFVVIVLTTGCAGSSKYAMFQPVPEGSDVHVVAVDPELKKPDPKSVGETVGNETAKGAAIGGGKSTPMC